MENIFCHMAHSPPSDAYFKIKLLCSVQSIVFPFFFKANNTAFREVVFLNGKNINLICAPGHGVAYILLNVDRWLSFGRAFGFLHILPFKLLEINKLLFKRCRTEMPKWDCICSNNTERDILHSYNNYAQVRKSLIHYIENALILHLLQNKG